MNERKETDSAPNRHVLNLALIISALSFIAVLYTRDFWPLIILFLSSIYLHRHRAKAKKEEERRNNITIRSYSIILLLPAGLILIALIYLFFWKLIPIIVSN